MTFSRKRLESVGSRRNRRTGLRVYSALRVFMIGPQIAAPPNLYSYCELAIWPIPRLTSAPK